MKEEIKILTIIGTRPEAIKMAPVIKEMEKHSKKVRSFVCVTGRHREMIDPVLNLFRVVPDFDLNVMQENQDLALLTARLLTALRPVCLETSPDWVLVQGDTTTTLAASLVAFYQKVRLAHVEAGLRTNDAHTPFPEEFNRRVTSLIADLHFAPTDHARLALLNEGICQDNIVVTGNTVIDALFWAREQVRENIPVIPSDICERVNGKKMILVTGHRRESFGEVFEGMCLALRDLVSMRDDVTIVYPVHLNPNVRRPVSQILGNADRVILTDPLPYPSFVWLLDRAFMVLTDSGGIQEEAPSLGKPVLVMREVTERPEGLESKCVELVGVKRGDIVEKALHLLTDSRLYEKMSQARNPYGDGKAAPRIVRKLLSLTQATGTIHPEGEDKTRKGQGVRGKELMVWS